jgi:serpin B
MSLTASLSAAALPSCTAIQLPYRGGRFAALAIMPRSGSVEDLLAGMEPARLAGIVGALRPGRIELRMPRFTTTASVQLDGALQGLGMRSAYRGDADFSALSSTRLRLGTVVQRVFLSVGEKGTQAAAATGAVLEPTAAVLPARVVAFDRPFLFLVRDTATGAILFAAAVEHPQG